MNPQAQHGIVMSTNWIKLATLAEFNELDEDEVLGVEIDGHRYALYRVGEEIFASDDICTHAFALLSHGWHENCEVECPLHGARFDIRTGKVLCGPATEDMRTYPVRVEGNDILADIAPRTD